MIVIKIDQTIEKWIAFKCIAENRELSVCKQPYELYAHTDLNGKRIVKGGGGKGKMEKSKHKSRTFGMKTCIFLANRDSLSFDIEN